MTDSGPVRNMWSTLSNKFEKQCVSLAFIIRIYHDARPSECQIKKFVITQKLYGSTNTAHAYPLGIQVPTCEFKVHEKHFKTPKYSTTYESNYFKLMPRSN